ncbi:MAG TPA: hypothetical protein VK153_03270 [Candidatus Paceibacterota bacterium]|nr:hypothetical protein [Candidatus Paceibacterota bacterium]
MNKANEISSKVGLIGLESGAIKINTKKPFLDIYGKFRPVFIDCNLFLPYPKYRDIVIIGIVEIVRNSVNLHHRSLGISGSETGIPWASSIAEIFKASLIYIQSDYGDSDTKKQKDCKEGIDLAKHRVILIDDVISTGRKNASTVASIRKMNGICDLCISIIDCGFSEAEKVFAGELPFKRDGFEAPIESLKSSCEKKSLLNLPQLIKVAWDNGFIEREEEKILLEWIENPEYWGDRHNFPALRKT